MSNYIDEAVKTKKYAVESGKNVYQVGHVIAIQKYILEVEGLRSVKYFERVVIQRPGVGDIAEGYVDKINTNSVIICLIKKTKEAIVGDEVISTGKEFTMQFSEDSIGHVTDMFARDLFSDERFLEIRELPVKSENTPIMDRGTVNRPFHTGIVGIDLMYPIGYGQRQLVLGDKRTGKTQIALDAIANQTKTNTLCIYVAIGKTKKEVKNIYAELSKRGAMNYTIIMAAFNDECSPVLKNTPYAALTVAKTFMIEKKADVFVVIDDLKRHADVCREISLLSNKVPGRDAYPSDIFYSHASLLEQGCQHNNGGSITILPICETKGGDITDYISTNIISITDGQIVLSTKNFERGQKPAIDYGLSVSRLGGAVQSGVIKKVSNVVRRELLSYLEIRDVYELTNENEMSEELQNKMRRGREIVKKLIQPKFSPQSENQIFYSFADLYKE